MMRFFAVVVCPDGGIVRNEQTGEVMNMEVGECSSRNEAIDQACHMFECRHVRNGVLRRNSSAGGLLVVDAQELVEI